MIAFHIFFHRIFKLITPLKPKTLYTTSNLHYMIHEFIQPHHLLENQNHAIRFLKNFENLIRHLFLYELKKNA